MDPISNFQVVFCHSTSWLRFLKVVSAGIDPMEACGCLGFPAGMADHFYPLFKPFLSDRR
jgi:hypothetical protein